MPARRSKLHTNTSPRRVWDTGRVASALKRAGIDTRHWISYGTVCVVGDDGEPNFTDPHAVYVGSEGVSVDVLLAPSGVPITCRYWGMGGPHGCIYYPVKAGDEVLVLMPEGELGGSPVALPPMTAEHSPLPLGPDRVPLFKNDRILIFAQNVPIDLRTDGGSRVLLQQDGTVEASGDKVSTVTDDTRLGSTLAAEQLVLGTSYRAAEQPAFVALAAWVAAVSAVIVDPGIVPTSALGIAGKAATAGLAATLSTLLPPLGTNPYLSVKSRTE